MLYLGLFWSVLGMCTFILEMFTVFKIISYQSINKQRLDSNIDSKSSNNTYLINSMILSRCYYKSSINIQKLINFNHCYHFYHFYSYSGFSDFRTEGLVRRSIIFGFSVFFQIWRPSIVNTKEYTLPIEILE